jgi:hypothetical protein
MGGLVGGIFDLVSGDPTQKEQSKFGNLADYDIGAGEGATTAAETYNENLLTNPTIALAPEISAGQNQVEQQKLQNANFGTRSGGTAASGEAADAAERGNIINLMGETQGRAADTLGTLGISQTGQGASALGNEAELANQRRQQQVGDINGIAQGAASIATGLMAPGAPSGIDPDIFSSLQKSGTVQPEELDLSTAQPEEIPL